MSTNNQRVAGRKAKLEGHLYEKSLIVEGYTPCDGYVPSILGGKTRSKCDAISPEGFRTSIKKQASGWQLQDSRYLDIIRMAEFHGASLANEEVKLGLSLYCGDDTKGIEKSISPLSELEVRQGRLLPSSLATYFPSYWASLQEWLQHNQKVLIYSALAYGLCASDPVQRIKFEEFGVFDIPELVEAFLGSVPEDLSRSMLPIGNGAVQMQRKSGGKRPHSLLIRLDRCRVKEILCKIH